MKVKEGVSLLNLQPQIVFAMQVADGVYSEYGYEMVITCVWREGGKSSLHPYGYAFDIRSNNIDNSSVSAVWHKLAQNLGNEFDVVLERDHIHVEWDHRKVTVY